MKKLMISAAITTVFFISGCAAPSPEVVQSHKFNSNNSYAMNIAMQTNLMTDQSRLRDFDKDEIDEVRKNIEKSKGNAPKVIGVFKILTGNLTGVIDVAGGAAADLALSNKDKFHQAASAKWIIALNADNYTSGGEAYKSAVNEIVTATKNVMGKYGELKNVAHNDKYIMFAINYNDKNYMLGLSNDPTQEFGIKNISFDNKNPKPLYVTGVDNKYYQIGAYSLEAFEVFKANGKTEDDILEDITALLPEGFFYYRPAFEVNTIPQSDFGKNIKYVNLDAVVPSVFTQGERYDFIKP